MDMSEKEKLLTEAVNSEKGLAAMGEAFVGRYKRLISGFTCNKCGSTEVYFMGAVMWGPYGGHRLCGGCGAIGDLYESVSRWLVVGTNLETGEEVQGSGQPAFTHDLKSPNYGKTLKRWRMQGGEWVEIEVPEDERVKPCN